MWWMWLPGDIRWRANWWKEWPGSTLKTLGFQMLPWSLKFDGLHHMLPNQTSHDHHTFFLYSLSALDERYHLWSQKKNAIKSCSKLLGHSNFYELHLLFKFRKEKTGNWSTAKADNAVSGKSRTSLFTKLGNVSWGFKTKPFLCQKCKIHSRARLLKVYLHICKPCIDMRKFYRLNK